MKNLFNKIKHWINAHEVISTIIFVGIIIFIAVIAGFIVHIYAPKVLPSQITADGMLAYIGAVLAAIGSILVAIVAVWQTKKANELSEAYNEIAKNSNEAAQKANELAKRAQELEEWHYKMEIRPFALISRVQYEERPFQDIIGKANVPLYKIDKNIDGQEDNESLSKYYGIIWITFSNTTNSLITISPFDCIYKENNETWNYSQSNNVIRKLSISDNGDGIIGFYATKELWAYVRDKAITFEFILENRFAERYKENIDLISSNTTKANPVFIEGQQETNDIFYSAQSYRIGKFNKDGGIDWE